MDTLLLPAWTQRQPLVDTIHCCDAFTLLRTLPDRSINCVVTSPPYFGLRDYKVSGQVGLEKTPQEYVDKLVSLFREVRRVLRDEGIVFLNLGDSYAGSWGNYAPNGIKNQQRPQSANGERWDRKGYQDTQFLPPTAKVPGLKPKDLIGIPWRVAFALQADGWYLRSAAPWIKASAMPESVEDRPTTAHEYVFQLSKSETYWFDREAILKPFADQRNGDPGKYTRTTQVAKGSNWERQDLGFVANGGNWDRGAEVGGRNRRTTDTFLDAMEAQIRHWQYVRDNGGVIVGEDTIDAFLVNTKPLSIAHFATFPTDLVEPCILSGCPDKVCEKCGAPWTRVVEREAYPDGYGNMGAKGAKWMDESDQSSGHRIQKNANALRAQGATHDTPFPKRVTTGWQPTCECGAGQRPGIVLDPFMGSGTTALVARATGRSYLGSDLNPDYVTIAKERLRQPFEQHHLVKETKFDDLPLFKAVGE